MIFKDIITGTTSSELVSINELELKARIGNNIDLSNTIIQKNIRNYRKNVTYRYAYTKLPFKIENGICYFENQEVKSSSLYKLLENSKEAFLLAVTSGISIDKLISKTYIQSPADSFYIDAISSAGIESYIDYINEIICDGLITTKRFSPGYGDFPIEFQKFLLDRLSAKETLGIMLTEDYLMIPQKSITAVIGIK